MSEPLRWTGNPNSQHQRWSRWRFGWTAEAKRPDVTTVRENASKFFKMGFNSSAGRIRCDRYTWARSNGASVLLLDPQGPYYVVEVEIEGPPVHDSTYREAVRQQFVDRFLKPGFGWGVELNEFEAVLLAGSREDGTPPDQMIVMPPLDSAAPSGLKAQFRAFISKRIRHG